MVRPASKPEFCTDESEWTVLEEDRTITRRCFQPPALNLNGRWLCWDHLEAAGFDTKALVE